MVVIVKFLPNKLEQKLKKYTFAESYVTICGKDEVMIENVSNVYECNEIMARVRAAGNDIVIWGENLKLQGYTSSTVTVFGKISSIELSSGGIN